MSGLATSEGYEILPFQPPPVNQNVVMGQLHAPAVPPSPLPIAASAAWQESFAAVPQSMRQFIASAEAEASGLGQGLGFHRTRAGRF